LSDRKDRAFVARHGAQSHLKEANYHISLMFHYLQELRNYTDDKVEYEYLEYFINHWVDYARLFYQTDRAVNRGGKDELKQSNKK